jgi:hypothetical protein
LSKNVEARLSILIIGVGLKIDLRFAGGREIVTVQVSCMAKKAAYLHSP